MNKLMLRQKNSFPDEDIPMEKPLLLEREGLLKVPLFSV